MFSNPNQSVYLIYHRLLLKILLTALWIKMVHNYTQHHVSSPTSYRSLLTGTINKVFDDCKSDEGGQKPPKIQNRRNIR